MPLLLEQLRSSDMALVGIGLRTARELPGRDVTEALAKELDQSNADRQVPLLLALAAGIGWAGLIRRVQARSIPPRLVRWSPAVVALILAAGLAINSASVRTSSI